MPVLVRGQNQWGATGAVIGGGSTGGGTGSSAATLAKPFSADSAWHSPYDYTAGASSQFDYPQFRNRSWWLNDGSTGGTMRIYEAKASDPTTTIQVVDFNNHTTLIGYRGWPAGSITWAGPAGMTPDPGGAGDQAMGIILTASNGLRYLLELWAVVKVSDTSWKCSGFGCSCIDGVSGFVPGPNISGPGGGQIYAAGNGWGDHAPNAASPNSLDWNSKQAAGIAASECSVFGGMLTRWDVLNGVVDHSLSILAQGADLAGGGSFANRVRPSKLPYGGGSGQIKLGMRLVFPGAPTTSSFSGVALWVRNSAIKYGMPFRDGAGGNSPIVQVDPGIGTYDRAGVISALNGLMQYGRISSWMNAAASPTT